MLAFAYQASSQNIWDNANSEVHPFLYRMAQRRLIEYNDLIKPMKRVHVLNSLNILKQKDVFKLEKQNGIKMNLVYLYAKYF